MRKNVGLFIIMVSVFLMGAAPRQDAVAFEMPWWGWLIIITVILIFMLSLTLGLDMSGSSDSEDE